MATKKAKKPAPKKPVEELVPVSSVEQAVQNALAKVIGKQAPKPAPEEASPLNLEFTVKVVDNNLELPDPGAIKANKDISWITMVEIVDKLANVVRLSALKAASEAAPFAPKTED